MRSDADPTQPPELDRTGRPLTLADLGREEIGRRLRAGDLLFRTGPFRIRIQSPLDDIGDGLALLYGDYTIVEPPAVADFHVAVRPVRGPRRWFRPQVEFLFDDLQPFMPLPRAQALPLLEWGLNWSVSSHIHTLLIIHAAAIERHGRAMVLPAPPGSGKSTLCGALVHAGWRLLSDELTMIDLATGRIVPLARPVNLKNQSIDVLRRRLPETVFSQPVRDTVKGTVALMRAPADSVARAGESAPPSWFVFPQYQAGSEMHLAARAKSDTLLRVGQNSFNYSVHGAAGFELLAALVDASDCYDFTYSDLDAAVALFADLAPPSGTGTAP